MIRTILKTYTTMNFRSPWIWSVTGTCLALLFLRSRSGIQGAAGFAFLFSGEGLVISIFFLGQMLATVEEAHRNTDMRIREPLESLPYHPAEWVTGRLLAQYFSWLAAGTFLWLAGMVMVTSSWEGMLEPFLWIGWARLLPVTLLFTVGISQALGSLIRSRFGGLGLAFLLYLSGRFLSMALGVLFRTSSFISLDMDLTTYFPLGPMGSFPDNDLLILNRLFTAAVGIGAVTFMSWLLARRRVQSRVWSGILCVLMIATATITVGITQKVLGQRVVAAVTEIERYRSDEEVSPYPAAHVSGYDVTLRLQPKDNLLIGEATVTLEGQERTVAFTLNHNLEVQEVIDPSGTSIPFSRAGDELVIQTDGQAGQYLICYEGPVMEWIFRGMPKLGAHVTEQSVMLPTGFGWYPLPGDQRLANLVRQGRNVNLESVVVRHLPVPFRLTVEGLPQLNLVTNVEPSQLIEAAWLIATPYVPEINSGVQFHVSPANRSIAVRLLEEYSDEAAFYEHLITLTGSKLLVEVPNSLAIITNTHDQINGYPGAVLLATTEFGIAYDGHMIDIIRGRFGGWWWSNPQSLEEGAVQRVLITFMSGLYGKVNPEVRGAVVFAGSRNSVLNDPESVEALKALRLYHEEYGLEATAALLRSLHNSDLPLCWHQLNSEMLKGGS